jgi:hypothetical protein
MSCIGAFLATPFLLWGALTVLTGTFYRLRTSGGRRWVVKGGPARWIGVLLILPFVIGATAMLFDVFGPMLALSLISYSGELSGFIGRISYNLVLFESGLAIAVVIAVSIIFRLNRQQADSVSSRSEILHGIQSQRPGT